MIKTFKWFFSNADDMYNSDIQKIVGFQMIVNGEMKYKEGDVTEFFIVKNMSGDKNE